MKQTDDYLKFVLAEESKTLNDEIGGIANCTRIINLDIVELDGQYSSADLRKIVDRLNDLKIKLENLGG